MESRSRLAPPGVRLGSVRNPFGVRSGSVRGPFGVRSGSVRGAYEVRSGSVRDQFGICSGSVRGPFGIRSASVRAPKRKTPIYYWSQSSARSRIFGKQRINAFTSQSAQGRDTFSTHPTNSEIDEWWFKHQEHTPLRPNSSEVERTKPQGRDVRAAAPHGNAGTDCKREPD